VYALFPLKDASETAVIQHKLTPPSRALIKKKILVVTQLLKKFSVFYRTLLDFITVFKRTGHWPLL
jgi:hypothetical protein